LNQLTKLNVVVIDTGQFKIFCFAFFQQISKDFIEFNYKNNQVLFDFYNPSYISEIYNDINSDLNSLEISNNENNTNNTNDTNLKSKLMNIFRGYTNIISNQISTKINDVKKQLLTPLISATERVVDMVLAVIYYNYILIFIYIYIFIHLINHNLHTYTY